MTALVRYQASILLRSYRWVFPLVAYLFLVSIGSVGSSSLMESLDWSGATLVPVVAFLTRAMLTAEPDAARACVAAATGPARAQLAALVVPLAGGAVLGLITTFADILTAEAASTVPTNSIQGKLSAVTAHPGIVVAGLLIALICLLVGAAIGTLLNPPLVRHPAVAMMSTLAAVVLAFVISISPASAALSQHADRANNPLAANWPGPGPVVDAFVLLLVCWTGSLLVAQRRESRFSGPD